MNYLFLIESWKICNKMLSESDPKIRAQIAKNELPPKYVKGVYNIEDNSNVRLELVKRFIWKENQTSILWAKEPLKVLTK
jgi:hypothetical protein